MKTFNEKLLIFLVDDDPIYMKVLEAQLTKNYYCSVEKFLTGEDCLAKLSEKPDIVFLDYYLNTNQKNAWNGLQILEEIKDHNSKIAVVMLSIQDQIDVAVNCMKNGAFDYIVKNETAFVRAQKALRDLCVIRSLKRNVTIITCIAIIIFIISLVLQIWSPNMING